LADFQNSFTVIISTEFETNSTTYFQPHLNVSLYYPVKYERLKTEYFWCI